MPGFEHLIIVVIADSMRANWHRRSVVFVLISAIVFRKRDIFAFASWNCYNGSKKVEMIDAGLIIGVIAGLITAYGKYSRK